MRTEDSDPEVDERPGLRPAKKGRIKRAHHCPLWPGWIGPDACSGELCSRSVEKLWSCALVLLNVLTYNGSTVQVTHHRFRDIRVSSTTVFVLSLIILVLLGSDIREFLLTATLYRSISARHLRTRYLPNYPLTYHVFRAR